VNSLCLKAIQPCKPLLKVILTGTIGCFLRRRKMTLAEVQSLITLLMGISQERSQSKSELVKWQQKLVEAIASVDEAYANQWLAAKSSGERITDGYADMMATAGTHGLREAVRRQFDVITNLLKL
jgi:hypothetical protein